MNINGFWPVSNPEKVFRPWSTRRAKGFAEAAREPRKPAPAGHLTKIPFRLDGFLPSCTPIRSSNFTTLQETLTRTQKLRGLIPLDLSHTILQLQAEISQLPSKHYVTKGTIEATEWHNRCRCFYQSCDIGKHAIPAVYALTHANSQVGGPSRGTRFRPLSLDVPKVCSFTQLLKKKNLKLTLWKPLFDVAGHPILWHCLRAVAKVPGIRDVILVGYYEEHVFRDFIKETSRELPQLRLQYLREYQALGTAGGLYHFRDAILKGGPDRFFVLNADVCCSFPLEQMLKLFEQKDAEAVILGTRVSNDAASNFGCIVSDPETKRVLHYVEKPESHISNLINCGVYLFSTEAIFPSIKSAIQRRQERPRLVSYPSAENLESSFAANREGDGEEKNEVLRLEQDILSDLADSNQFYVLETKDFWRQIKTAGSAVPANALYLQKAFQSQSKELAAPSATILPPVYIHPSAEVDPTAKLGPHVSIGPRAVVGAGARIKESIVLEDAEIKHDACVLYSIIGWNSRVGAWARVEGSPTPVGSHTSTIVKNGVKVQCITILGKDCGVGDEVRVQNCVCLPNKELKRVSLRIMPFHAP